MNISHVRTFVTVVEHKSFSNAARVLGVSQPAVTMQIQALESDLGATLLERRYRRVELTEAGRVLLPYARKLLTEVDEARYAIESMAGRVSGRLGLAASTTPGQYVLPRLLGDFLQVHPEVGVSLAVMDTAQVIDAVERGDADLGMAGAEVPGARVVAEECGSDDVLMIAPPTDKHAASGSRLTIQDVAERPFIMRERGSGTRTVMEATFSSAGVNAGDLQVVMELGSSEAVVSAVEGGMGLGVVSRWVAEKALTLGTVVELPVLDFPVKRPLYLVSPRGTLTRAADALRDYLRERSG